MDLSPGAAEVRVGHMCEPQMARNRNRPRESAFRDVVAMTECDHCYDKDVVVDRVDDAVIADANPDAGAASEGFGARWPWLFTEERDCPADAVAILVIYSLQGANCRRTQLDLVGHVQPRSAST